MHYKRLPLLVLLAALLGVGVGWLLHIESGRFFPLTSSRSASDDGEGEEVVKEIAPTLEDMPVADGKYFEDAPAPLMDVPIDAWGVYGASLRESFAGTPNFNGKYILLSAPCTMPSCVAGFLFDAASGEFVAAMTGRSLTFSLDSTLLIVESMESNEVAPIREFYIIRDRTLVLLGREDEEGYQSIPEEHCTLSPTSAKNDALGDERQFPHPCSLWPGYVKTTKTER